MANFLENLVLTNENIKDLRELINVNTLRDERISDYVRVVAARSGDRLGLISGVEIGTAGCACDPTYVSMNPTDVLKVWALGCWEAPLKVCSKDIITFIRQYNGRTDGELTWTVTCGDSEFGGVMDGNRDKRQGSANLLEGLGGTTEKSMHLVVKNDKGATEVETDIPQTSDDE